MQERLGRQPFELLAQRKRRSRRLRQAAAEVSSAPASGCARSPAGCHSLVRALLFLQGADTSEGEEEEEEAGGGGGGESEELDEAPGTSNREGSAAAKRSGKGRSDSEWADELAESMDPARRRKKQRNKERWRCVRAVRRARACS